jgi:hypothetical protein
MSRGVNGYADTRPHRTSRVAKLRTGTREYISKAVHIATCMVTQLRLINASVISLRLTIYGRVQQTAAVELHVDKQQLGEGRGE